MDFALYANLVSTSISLLASDAVIGNLNSSIFIEGHESRDVFLKTCENAKREKTENFPHLYNQLVVTLYSYLDSGIKEFIRCLFRYKMSIYNLDEIRIKISISDTLITDKDELAHMLFKQYSRQIFENRKDVSGVTKFQMLLKPFGYTATVDNNISKEIFELARIRNAIVHSFGVADEQAVKSLAHLNYKLGDKIVIDNGQFNRYIISVIAFIRQMVKEVNEELEVIRQSGEYR